jgi:hypothetical protein
VTPIKRKTKPPKIGAKWRITPSAIPGRATCERASDIKAIRRRIRKEPTRPEAAATQTPEIKVKVKISIFII